MNRQEKKRAKRERLISAALALFSEQGFENVTVEKIAQKAQVSKGTFFNYFPCKRDVLLAIGNWQLDWLAERVESRLGNCQPQAIPSELMNLIVQMLNRITLTPRLMQAIFVAAFGHPEAIESQAAQAFRFFQILIPLFVRGQATGVFTNELSPEQMARSAIRTYYGLLLSWSAASQPGGLEEQFIETFFVFFRGIAAKANG